MWVVNAFDCVYIKSDETDPDSEFNSNQYLCYITKCIAIRFVLVDLQKYSLQLNHTVTLVESIENKIIVIILLICFNFALIFFQKCFSDFELQGVPENTLNAKTYQTICSRLQVTM